MSLLIEALRRAEASAPNATATPAPVAAKETKPLDQRQAAQELLAAIGARPQRRHTVHLRRAVYAAIGVALAGGTFAALVLTRPDPAPALASSAQKPNPAPPEAPAEETPPPSTAALSPAAQPATPAEIKRQPEGASPPRRQAAATAAAATPPVAEAKTAPPAPAALVQEGAALQPPLAAAYSALQAGRLEEAEQLYRRALEVDPRQPDALLGLAAAAEQRGATADAIALYRRVLTLQPDHPLALAAVAELSAASDGAAQESALRQALARQPAAAALHAALARLLASQQRWSEAQLSFAAAWELEPDRAERAYDLAVALDRLRKSEAAAGMYARALAQAGSSPGFDIDAAQARLRTLREQPQAGR